MTPKEITEKTPYNGFDKRKNRLLEFIAEENIKIEKAKELTQQLNSFYFNRLDPRWWKTKKQLHKVIKSFLQPTFFE
jgi:hypothetical protein